MQEDMVLDHLSARRTMCQLQSYNLSSEMTADIVIHRSQNCLEDGVGKLFNNINMKR